MEKRLNDILSGMAKQHAYHILPNAPKDARRLGYLADGLATNGFLVMVAVIPENNHEFLLNTWADSYKRLYAVISSHLFPSYTGINMWMADSMLPPVVVIQGQTPAVIQVLAGYVVPYVAMRQKMRTTSDAEIRGLMTYILDELDDELNRVTYDAIWRQCTQIIRQLLTIPIEHYSLTSMKKPLFQQTDAKPKTTPLQKPRPARPKTLPETGRLDPSKLNGTHADEKPSTKKKTGSLSSAWFGDDDDSDDKGFFPPVPSLKPPDEDN